MACEGCWKVWFWYRLGSGLDSLSVLGFLTTDVVGFRLLLLLRGANEVEEELECCLVNDCVCFIGCGGR